MGDTGHCTDSPCIVVVVVAQRDTMRQRTRQYVAPAPSPHLHKRPHQRHRALKPCLFVSYGQAKRSQLSVVLAPLIFFDCRLTASNSRFRISCTQLMIENPFILVTNVPTVLEEVI